MNIGQSIIKQAGNRYEYMLLYVLDTKEPMHIVTDKEATDIFNS